MAKRVVFDTQEAKEFTKVFAQFCSRRSAWSAWSDYITLTACSISVVVDHSPERFKERSSLLQTTMDRYTEEEIAQFDAMNTILMDGMTKNPGQALYVPGLRIYMARAVLYTVGGLIHDGEDDARNEPEAGSGQAILLGV